MPRQLPLEVTTFAEHLKGSGYATGYFGKWHLGGKGFGPQEQGWQTALELQGNTQPPEASGGMPRRTAQMLTEKAIEFINANTKHPFVLQVSHAAVHIPLTTTPELLAKYQSKTKVANYPCLPAYAGLLEELDQSVGKIVDAVDRAGIAKHTLIVFLSDNGGLEHEQSGRVVTSNQPLRGEKGTLYEGGIRVPAIFRWPGTIPEKSLCNKPAITMDLFPTFTEIASANLPQQPYDGVSLFSNLRNPSARLDRLALYWHLPHYHHSTPASAIRNGAWKLIEFYETGTIELYNLSEDSSES